MRNALNGDQELLLYIADKYKIRPKETSPSPVVNLTLDKDPGDALETEAQKDTREKHTKSAPKRPVRPPHLSFDAQKQPFLRPRFGRHNQSLSMTLLSRTLQHQKRTDRQTGLAWAHFYASAEELFYKNLGISDPGWVDEVALAQADLSIRFDESEQAKVKRWDELQELHKRLMADYERDMDKWRSDTKRWKEGRTKDKVAE